MIISDYQPLHGSFTESLLISDCLDESLTTQNACSPCQPKYIALLCSSALSPCLLIKPAHGLPLSSLATSFPYPWRFSLPACASMRSSARARPSSTGLQRTTFSWFSLRLVAARCQISCAPIVDFVDQSLTLLFRSAP